MTVYGNFEAVAQVFKTHHGSVWSARTAGTDEAADCCVKVLELNQAMLQERDTTLAQNALVAAALQQAMANKSEFWAPVFGLGSQGTNAFYVSRLYPRSVQTLIENNTELTAAELRIILLGVIDGLLDLQTAFNRPHGNLRPSNILLGDKTKIREGSIFLCDPDASHEQVPSLTRTPDSKAIGELIYALVMHRPHTTARFPLPDSEKWKQLGSSGRQWKSLCENLLNTLSRRVPSLEHLRNQVEAIRPTRRRMPRSVFALLALAALGAGAYVKRDQLSGLYHQATVKVNSLIASTKSRPPLPYHPYSTTQSTQPARAVVQAPVPIPSPVIVPKPVVVVKAPSPTPASAVLPVDPPLHRAPVEPREPVGAVLHSDAEAIKIITGTESPDFHSAAAKAEFIHNRDQFAATHATSIAGNALGDWGKILSKIQGIDADYPPLDPASTTGWPEGLVAVVNARRDAALVHAIDGAFVGEHADPTAFSATLQKVQTAASAVAAAHEAMARGDIVASQKAIDDCNRELDVFPPNDSDLTDLFAPVKKEFITFNAVAGNNDRAALLQIAETETNPLAMRLEAWLRAGSAGIDPWPAEIPALAADLARADRLSTLLQEAGSVEIAGQVAKTQADRENFLFSRLRDQQSVTATLKSAVEPKYAVMLAKSPVWFRYDAALYLLRNTPTSQITAAQKQNYSDLAGQVEAPGVQLVHAVLKAAEAPPLTLAQSGPGSVKGWQLRGGWTKKHCTFSSTAGDTLEFLRVHVPTDPDGVDCYLCTTETPVALMQHLLAGNAAAYAAARTLNTPANPPKPGMRLWTFNDKSRSVDLDDDDYRKCFVVSPDDQLPLQCVTPQAAFFLARSVGCRLPTSSEWTAALAMARTSTDTNMKGFATMGWKLRDGEFAKLLANPNRDPNYWPDDNIFLGNLDPAKVQTRASASIWTTGALVGLGGSVASDAPSSVVLWPLSTLQSSSGFGFRGVGDGDNYSGVFHDLIGNVAEYVMDAPVVLAEKVAVAPPLAGNDIVARVTDWFSPEHLAGVCVIGGSALSPPGLDPTKPCLLPRNANQFSDVGFRLAFTDPACLANAQREVIAQAPYLTAP